MLNEVLIYKSNYTASAYYLRLQEPMQKTQ